ncbi:hypothetical protein [Paeniglutamicibacter sp. NPDC091659]|uniref:hypothetical protein n=1 Tax=Paeniglutamicibacter sp. NPDC091659 TaxID=3364389 RepID=UPI00380D7500
MERSYTTVPSGLIHGYSELVGCTLTDEDMRALAEIPGESSEVTKRFEADGLHEMRVNLCSVGTELLILDDTVHSVTIWTQSDPAYCGDRWVSAICENLPANAKRREIHAVLGWPAWEGGRSMTYVLDESKFLNFTFSKEKVAQISITSFHVFQNEFDEEGPFLEMRPIDQILEAVERLALLQWDADTTEDCALKDFNVLGSHTQTYHSLTTASTDGEAIEEFHWDYFGTRVNAVKSAAENRWGEPRMRFSPVRNPPTNLGDSIIADNTAGNAPVWVKDDRCIMLITGTKRRKKHPFLQAFIICPLTWFDE